MNKVQSNAEPVSDIPVHSLFSGESKVVLCDLKVTYSGLMQRRNARAAPLKQAGDMRFEQRPPHCIKRLSASYFERFGAINHRQIADKFTHLCNRATF
jgi:hypothetical protein